MKRIFWLALGHFLFSVISAHAQVPPACPVMLFCNTHTSMTGTINYTMPPVLVNDSYFFSCHAINYSTDKTVDMQAMSEGVVIDPSNSFWMMVAQFCNHIEPGGSCAFGAEFSPTSESVVYSTHTFDTTVKSDLQPQLPGEACRMRFEFQGKGYATLPEPEPTPTPTPNPSPTPEPDPDAPINETEPNHVEPGKCVKTRRGSVIRVDNLTFGELVPIVGTQIALVYSSEFAEDYLVQYDKINRHVSFNPEGWSISIVHYYDIASNRLYHGSGRSLGKPSMELNTSELMVVEGNEVFVFSKTNGRHLRTLSALTGIVKHTNYYTASGKLSKIIDRFGNETTFSRRVDGSLQKVISPFGRETAVYVNGSGMISRIANPASQSHYIEYYTDKDLLKRFVLPSGRSTEVQYDSTGRLSRTRSAGSGWDFKLTGDGDSPDGANYLKQTSTSGQVWKYNLSRRSLDGKYRRWEKSPSGDIETYYEDDDESSTVVSSEGSISIVNHNDPRFGTLKSRLSMVEERIGPLTKTSYFDQFVSGLGAGPFQYDAIEGEVEVNGAMATSVFTRSTGMAEYASSEGVQWYSKINSSEQIIEYKYANDEPVIFEYDIKGRISKGVQASRTLFDIQYDNYGQLSSVGRSGQGSVGYQYDLAGRVVMATFADGNAVAINYNQDGLVSGVTPPGRQMHSFVYNSLGLVQSYIPPVSPGVDPYIKKFKYDSDKRLTSLERPDYEEIRNIYGKDGNLVLTKYGNLRQSYFYEKNSSRVSQDISFDGILQNYRYLGSLLESVTQKMSSGGEKFSTVTYSYDNSFRIKERRISTDYLSSDVIIRSAYSLDNKIIRAGAAEFDYSGVSGRLSGSRLKNTSDTFLYNEFGELVKYEAKYLGQVVFSYDLVRDVSGRIVKNTENVLGRIDTFQYSYDLKGRLSQVVRNDVVIGLYSFDQNGNRVSGQHNGKGFAATYDSQDKLISFNGVLYSYNQNGDLVNFSAPIWSGSSKIDYNPYGKMAEYTRPDGVSIKYISDSFGRPIAKELNGSSYSRVLFDGELRVISVFDELKRNSKEFVHGVRGSTPDYMQFKGKIYRYVVDHLGSPRLLIDVETGRIAQKLDYDVWGREIYNSNKGFQPYGFAGGLVDEHTQFIRFGARDYDPGVGRWISKDPILFEGGDVNLYAYVANDPVNYFDPTGTTMNDLRMAEEWIRKNDPELYKNLNPKVVNKDLGKTLFGGEIYGLTESQHLIYLDFSKLDKFGEECSIERVKGYVDMLSHELGHARDFEQGKWWNTRFINEFNGRHNEIEDRAFGNGMRYGD